MCGDRRAVWMKPLLVMDGRPTMRVAQSDVFAPVLTVMHFKNVDEMLRGEALCPYGLTASIFGDEKAARQLAQCLEVGTVLINDLIVPTVDPRVPFGGRRQAGFGTTRGAEGLLEMTAAKTTLTRRGQATRHYDSTGDHHETMFTGLAELTHGRGLRSRINGLQMMLAGAKKLQRGKV